MTADLLAEADGDQREAVAVSLFCQEHYGDPGDKDGRLDWMETTERVRDHWRRNADAAIAALRAPTDAEVEKMAEAAWNEFEFWNAGKDGLPWSSCNEGVHDAWRDIIRAALKARGEP